MTCPRSLSGRDETQPVSILEGFVLHSSQPLPLPIFTEVKKKASQTKMSHSLISRPKEA